MRNEDMKGDAMYKIYRTPVHHLGPSSEPDYLLYAGQLFPTASHPRGWSETRAAIPPARCCP